MTHCCFLLWSEDKERWVQHQEVGVIEGERGALENVAYVSKKGLGFKKIGQDFFDLKLGV